MKTRMKIITNTILFFLIIIALSGFLKSTIAYGSEKYTDTELLIVIDNSGSMKENLDFLNNLIDSIKLLADERNVNVKISYLAFNETVQMKDTFEEVKIASGKETCIMQGIEAADQWMEEKIDSGTHVNVLFISDLFSSRYLEKDSGEIKKYDIDTADTEQTEISNIEEKWAKWISEKKAGISIWTWESLCQTEKKENTIAYLKENNKHEISYGYQVKFEPIENTVLNITNLREAGTNTEFIKLTICSFETLFGSSNINGQDESYFINPGEERKLKLNEDEKLIYLFFPESNGIRVTYKGIDVETTYDGLYLLDQKEHEYIVIGQTDIVRTEGFLLKVPDLKWEITFSGTLKRKNDFAITLTPSESLNGSWGTPDNYNCILRILDENKTEIYNKQMEYNFDQGTFSLEHKITTSGYYTFICEVNGKEVQNDKRKIN